MNPRILLGLLCATTVVGCRPDAQPTGPGTTPEELPSFGPTQTSAPWGLDRIDQINLPLNSQYTYHRSGSGVYIYVLDQGVNPSDGDLTGRVLTGYNSAGGGSTSDCNPSVPHGTWVSRIAAGTTYGVAKNASIIPVRIVDEGCLYSVQDMIDGLNWVAQDVTHRPAVINISAGFAVTPGSESSILQLEALLLDLNEGGLGIVVSAGNLSQDACGSVAQSPNSPQSPARAPTVITVGGSTSSDGRAATSNFGSCLDLYAPGHNVPCGAAQSCSGTSFAAPHVAGAIALYLEGKTQQTGATVVSRANAKLPVLSGTTNKLLYMQFIPPPAPSGAVPSNVTANSATVTWTTGDPTFQTLVEYRIHGVANYTNAGTVAAGVSSKALSGLTASSIYDVRLTHTKTNVDPAQAQFLSLFTTQSPPPSPPTAVIFTNYSGGTQPRKNQTCWYYGAADGDGTVTVAWYRKNSGSSTWTLIGTTNDISTLVGIVNFELKFEATSQYGVASDIEAVIPQLSGGATCVL